MDVQPYPQRTARRYVLRKSSLATFLFVCAALTVGTGALAQSPVIATQTPLAGEVGATFFVFLPLLNSGAVEADNVQATSVTLGQVHPTSPSLPYSVGTLVPVGLPGNRDTGLARTRRDHKDHYVLDLRFDADDFVTNSLYLLTLGGTYQIGGESFGFSVNCFLTIATPTGSQLTELQRWVALDDVQTEFASLPGLDPVADSETMLTFLQGRPEFVNSGIASDASSVWARFADGEPIIIYNDRLGVGQTSPTEIASKLPTASNVLSTIPLTHPATAITPTASADPPSELPTSSSAQVLNAMGPGYAAFDTGLSSDLISWLQAANYTASASAQPSVDYLKRIGGDGVFFLSSHGGFYGAGTAADPQTFGVWTSTVADPLNDVLYRPDLSTGTPPLSTQPTLIRVMAKEGLDSTGTKASYVYHYAITAQFVSTYWRMFSPNSIVYIDACNSASFGARGFQQAIFNKGASLYVGWTGNVPDGSPGNPLAHMPFGYATDTARLVFDRLLGSNTFTTPVGTSLPLPVLEMQITGFNQRPFDYNSVSNDLMIHGLGAVNVIQFLDFLPNPSSSPGFALLAPTISNMSVNEAAGTGGQLTIYGVFGGDPRAGGSGSDGMVTVGGPNSPANIESWNPNYIVVDLSSSGPSSSGDVQVWVRGHGSNVARVTEWQGQLTLTATSASPPPPVVGPPCPAATLACFQSGNCSEETPACIEQNSQSETITFRPAFRADIRQWRPVIHQPPSMPVVPIISAMIPGSSAMYSCNGTAQAIIDPIQQVATTTTWTGSGNLVPFGPTGGSFSSSFGIDGFINSNTTINMEFTVGALNTCSAIITTTTGGTANPQSNTIPFLIPPPLSSFVLNLDPSTAVIQPSLLNFTTAGCPGPLAGVVASCPSTFQWNSIPPVANTAPDPNSAR